MPKCCTNAAELLTFSIHTKISFIADNIAHKKDSIFTNKICDVTKQLKRLDRAYIGQCYLKSSKTPDTKQNGHHKKKKCLISFFSDQIHDRSSSTIFRVLFEKIWILLENGLATVFLAAAEKMKFPMFVSSSMYHLGVYPWERGKTEAATKERQLQFLKLHSFLHSKVIAFWHSKFSQNVQYSFRSS